MKAILFPGQGSQYKGMGKDLFRIYRNETLQASEIVGYDIEELCTKDPKRELGKTQYTQPAVYVVNAFSYYNQKSNGNPDYFAGHSLGEYNALLAAGAFDFQTGLRLVQKRGLLMAAASGGGMAAVLGLNVDEVRKKLEQDGYHDIDIANYNTPTQTVIAGKEETINKAIKHFDSCGIKIIPLFVSAPFHSRYMKTAAEEFAGFINEYNFSPLKTPVIANVSARPYENDQFKKLLSNQISNSVKWTDSIRFMMGRKVSVFEEVGNLILTKMVDEIKANCTAIYEEETYRDEKPKETPVLPGIKNGERLPGKVMQENNDLSKQLGNKKFREDYGIKYAYISGAMYKGISSKELVICMAKAGMLGFLGTAGMSLKEIEENINYIKSKLADNEPYGMNLIHSPDDVTLEMQTVTLFLKHAVQRVEAAAFVQITPALIYYRLKGLRKKEGQVICDNKIIAKVSRPEVAEMFMRPAPESIVNKLLSERLITEEEAALSKEIPVGHDICVEADSGGHTDGGVAMVLLPAMQLLKNRIEKDYHYQEPLRVGLAGGLGTPESIACAFMMNADFVVTGSINQCTVESGTSDAVKDLLQEINIQDTDYAPAGDMFEIGAKVQVLKRGVLFPARANKLYTLYHQYNSLEEIPVKIIEQMEKNYFKKSISEVWEETKDHKRNKGMEPDIAKAERNPKHKMALVFRWYFGYSSRLALQGDINDKVNFQVHTGPSLGAFNQWVKGTELENWRNRHADNIGIMMMEGAACLLKERLKVISSVSPV